VGSEETQGAEDRGRSGEGPVRKREPRGKGEEGVMGFAPRGQTKATTNGTERNIRAFSVEP
jgi:hypothetical protein